MKIHLKMQFAMIAILFDAILLFSFLLNLTVLVELNQSTLS